MTDRIIWATPDGSWGGCERDDIIIVSENDMTRAELDALNAAIMIDDDNGIFRILADADYRIRG